MFIKWIFPVYSPCPFVLNNQSEKIERYVEYWTRSAFTVNTFISVAGILSKYFVPHTSNVHGFYPTHFTCLKTVTHPPYFSRSPPTPTPLCNDQSLSSNLLDIEKSVIVFQWNQNWGYYCGPPCHFLVHILQGTCDFFFRSIVPFVSIIQLEGVLDSYKIKELYILRFLVSLAWTCVLGAWG